MDQIVGYTNPVPIGNGYFVAGCDACGSAILIDERHHEGDGRDTHTKWHEEESNRVTDSMSRQLAQRDIYG